MITPIYCQGAEGVRLHAATAGDSGPLMLLVHGFPEFWQAWHRQLPEFSRDHRVVALDLRGYNLSDKPDGVTRYELPRIANDLRHVINELSPGRPAILVGHDWGGVAGWTLARESPELLQRMVIINAPHPAIFRRELKHMKAQLFASSYAAFFQLRGVAEMTLRSFNFAALRKMVFGTTANPGMFSPELRAAYMKAWRQPHALTSALNFYRNIRALHRLAASGSWRIEVPTLVLWGEKDPALLRGNLTGLEEFVPQLTVQRHPAATHWIVHEEPHWVNAHIRNFVAGTRSGLG